MVSINKTCPCCGDEVGRHPLEGNISLLIDGSAAISPVQCDKCKAFIYAEASDANTIVWRDFSKNRQMFLVSTY